MSHRGSVCIGVVALLAVVSCLSTKVIPLGTYRYQYMPVPTDSVQVFLAEADIKVPFEKIALIKVSGEESWADEPKMIKACRKKAGEIGANGIILGPIEDASTAAVIAKELLGTPAKRKGEVVAVRLHPSAEEDPAPPEN